jgi:aspartate racemase
MGAFHNGIVAARDGNNICPMFPLACNREDTAQPRERCLGVIGGPESLASADFLQKLVAATEAHGDACSFNIVFQQRASAAAMNIDVGPTARQLYLFDMIDGFASRGVGTVAIPCITSHEFIEELKANSPVAVADMLDAVRSHVRQRFPTARRIGIVTSAHLRARGSFERYFPHQSFEILYCCRETSASPQTFRKACAELVAQGAELIIPGLSEWIPLVPQIGLMGVPVIDPHRIYAQYLVSEPPPPPQRPFKLGVVGGVGPAATVDFLQKVVRNTPARRDQDHLKILVEQNPQIPDRTEHLLGKGPDPTLALYATCRKLQAGAADLIAIPCNTAHAFIDVIQPHLDIPIVNMLAVTVSHIHESFPALREVGLLATSGTLASGIYHRALQKQGLREIVPPPALQTQMMSAIYGPQGIKAGYTTGPCVDDIDAVINDLVSRGAKVIILGCTELPLLFDRETRDRQRATLVDPTDILAMHCVSRAKAHSRC